MRWLFWLFLLSPSLAWGQAGYIRIPACNTASPPQGASNGYMDANGNICQYSIGAMKPGPLTPLAATQTLILTSSAQSLTVPAGALYATFAVTAASNTAVAAIYRDDGTAPTATVGMTLPDGVWNYSGSLAAIQFILPTGVTGTIVTASFYK